MLVDGLIEETKDAHDFEFEDERRRIYRLTGFGREVARTESLRLEILVETARQRKLLSNPPDAL